MPKLVSFICLVCSLLLASEFNPALAQTSAPVLKQQDGIRASLAVRPNEAILRWRFLRPLSSPMTGITGVVDDRNTAIKAAAQPYPYANARTLIVLLIDVSDFADPQRKEFRKRQVQSIVGNAKPHDVILPAVFAQDSQQLRAQGSDASGIIAELDGLASPAPTARLGLALQAALKAFEGGQGDRGAVFVLTDGHHDDNFNASALAESAKAKDINVYFIQNPSQRSSDLAALSTIASASGGFVIGPDQQSEFLRTPFALLDSGGMARFPLTDQRSYFWESGNTFKVSMQYGDRKLELSAPVDLHSATAIETATYIFGRYQIVLLFLIPLLALAAMGLGLFFGFKVFKKIWARRPRGHKTLPVLAVLKDKDSGAVYAAHKPISFLGRGPDNEIVIADSTVSRVHAVLQQNRNGGFSIANKSEVNKLQVNEQDVEQVDLSDGDLIGLGEVKLRFSRPRA